MSDLVVVGSLNMDMVLRTPRMPEVGETIQGEELRYFPGGKGANQASAAAKLGCSTAMVGKVGADEFGEKLVDNIREAGVVTEHVLIDNHSPTGTAVIIIDQSGDNFIIVSEGANGNLARRDIEEVKSIIKKSNYVLLQFEIPLDTVEHVVEFASAHGVKIILNPAPAKKINDDIIKKVRYLIPNETELQLLTDLPVVDLDSAQVAATQMIQRGIQVVVVTMGAQGALIVRNDGSEYVPAFEVDVVDTTAAGDAFIGGFCFGLLHNMKLSDAVRYGCAAGALATTKMGAQNSLPNNNAVDTII